jgi:hypothetical protein
VLKSLECAGCASLIATCVHVAIIDLSIVGSVITPMFATPNRLRISFRLHPFRVKATIAGLACAIIVNVADLHSSVCLATDLNRLMTNLIKRLCVASASEE